MGVWQSRAAKLDRRRGPYIEVQSGPLPTQSDYGMLGPHERVVWREWWYPVHGLGDGFEFATRNLAVQTSRQNGKLELRLLATGSFPRATCELHVAGKQGGQSVAKEQVDLSPLSPVVLTCRPIPNGPSESK